MLSFTGSVRVLLCLEPCDMRMGFNGLAGLVANKLAADIQSGALFVFTNRSRTRLKVLHWDGTGLWMLSKRLERGAFEWPAPSAAGQVRLALDATAFAMLTDGISLRKASRRPWYEAAAPESPPPP
jgi:transposase